MSAVCAVASAKVRVLNPNNFQFDSDNRVENPGTDRLDAVVAFARCRDRLFKPQCTHDYSCLFPLVSGLRSGVGTPHNIGKTPSGGKPQNSNEGVRHRIEA
jgi:hypothetical protein